MNTMTTGETATSTTNYIIQQQHNKRHRNKPPPPPPPRNRRNIHPPTNRNALNTNNTSYERKLRLNTIQPPSVIHHQKLNSNSSMESLQSYNSSNSTSSSTSFNNLPSPSTTSSSNTSPYTHLPLPSPSPYSKLSPTKSMPTPSTGDKTRNNQHIQLSLDQKRSFHSHSAYNLPALPDSLPSPKHYNINNKSQNKHNKNNVTTYNPHKYLKKHITPIHIIQSNINCGGDGHGFDASPRSPISPVSPTRVTRSSRSSSTSSNGSNYNYYHRKSSSRGSSNKQSHGRHIYCICGRKMDYTQNPMDKYPPNAILYCQQSRRCKKKMIIAKDYFYCCRARTSYHGTKDGTFKCCYSCSISAAAKQERIRKNHQLLIKQLKSNHRGKVLITKDTKDYILSSTSSHSKDETLKLLKQTYIDQQDEDDKKNDNISTKTDRSQRRSKSNKPKLSNVHHTKSKPSQEMQMVNGTALRIIKQGFMMKKGNVWNKAFKKRYFKLLENKQLFYYKTFDRGIASDERGCADLNVVTNMIKKGKNGMEVITPSREWKFLCTNQMERDEWYEVIKNLCCTKQQRPSLNKSKTYTFINPLVAEQVNGNRKKLKIRDKKRKK